MNAGMKIGKVRGKGSTISCAYDSGLQTGVIMRVCLILIL